MDIGQRIAQARKDRGLTQRQVAEALSVSVQAVSLWETNKASPPSERLRRLATLLGVGSLWLSGDDEALASDRPKLPEAVAHLIQLEELIPFLCMKAQDRSKHYEEISTSKLGSGILFAIQLGEYGHHDDMVLLAPHQIASDASTADGDSGDIYIFDTGRVARAGDLALVINTEVDGSRYEAAKAGVRSLPIHMSIAIERIRPQPDEAKVSDDDAGGEKGDGVVAALKAMDALDQVTIGEPTVVAVLVEERRFRGRAGRDLFPKPRQGRCSTPLYGGPREAEGVEASTGQADVETEAGGS